MDRTTPRAVADTEAMTNLGCVELDADPERVFQALISAEVTRWWVRPGVFDTQTWEADARTGGGWRATGIGGGRPYTLEGEYVNVEPPRRLVHTWRLVGLPGATSTATYLLAPLDDGDRTRLTFRQDGFTSPDSCIATAIGWETSFEALKALLECDKAA